MIFGLLSLCAISVLSNWLAEQLNIPIPGAIIGLLLLMGLCAFRGRAGASLDRSSQLLTLLIPLLIMPSCIGIMDHWHLIKKEWLAILIAITLSVLFTLISTPWLYSKMHVDSQNEVS